MRRYVGLAVLIVALIVSGCSRSKQTESPNSPTKTKKVYGTYVSLSPSATELLAGLTRVERLKGRTASCNYPTNISTVPIVMSATKPDYELIATLKPGLIVYEPKLFSEADIDKLKELKIDLFPLKAGTVLEFEDTLFRLGGMIRGETNFSEYVDKIEAAKSLASAKTTNPKTKVAIIMPGDGAEHMIAGTKSFTADVVRVSGGDVVGPDADKFVVLNVESLVTLNPDVIIVAGEPSSVVNDPRLASVKAIKDNRVVGVNQDLILRAGGRLDRLITKLAGYL